MANCARLRLRLKVPFRKGVGASPQLLPLPMLCQPGFKRPSSGFGLVIERSATLDASCGKHNAPMRKSFWPSGLRRWLKAPFRKSMASSPTLVVVACDLSPPSPTRSPAAQQQTRMARPIFGSCAGAAGERGALEVQGRSVDACGPVDTASACGAGDRRFESCRSHNGRRCWTHPETLPPRSGTPLDADTHAVPPPGGDVRSVAPQRPCCPTDKASAYGVWDCRFESCRGPNGRTWWKHPETLRPSVSTWKTWVKSSL